MQSGNRTKKVNNSSLRPKGCRFSLKKKNLLITVLSLGILLLIGIIVLVVRINKVKDIVVEEDISYFSGEREEEFDIKSVEKNVYENSLFLAWYDQKENKEEKVSYYIEQVGKIVNAEAEYEDVSLELLDDEEREKYLLLKEKIDSLELNKVPKKYQKMGITDFQEIPIDELVVQEPEKYWENSQARFDSYFICPNAAMLQQMARNAGDASVGALKEEIQIESEILEYTGRSVDGYATLLKYRDVSEAKADICHWEGDNFHQLAANMDHLDETKREHFYLMAYAFYYWGTQCWDEGEVDHKEDLKNNLSEVGEILKGIYGYSMLE